VAMFKSFSPKKSINLDCIRMDDSKNIPADMVQGLYLSVGWQYRKVQEIKTSFESSILVVSAWDNEMLIGIGRATGDGIFNATRWDVAVRPAYQKSGVGTLIVKTMLTKLNDYGIPLITLYTEWPKKNFYSKLGFEFNSNIIGMYKHNNKHK
jgi:GNAT superfamily N-acetyltransferase